MSEYSESIDSSSECECEYDDDDSVGSLVDFINDDDESDGEVEVEDEDEVEVEDEVEPLPMRASKKRALENIEIITSCIIEANKKSKRL